MIKQKVVVDFENQPRIEEKSYRIVEDVSKSRLFKANVKQLIMQFVEFLLALSKDRYRHLRPTKLKHIHASGTEGLLMMRA